MLAILNSLNAHNLPILKPILMSSADFLKTIFFKKIFQEHYQSSNLGTN